ncbi:phosphopentomutase [Brachyspira catarrhinii]|uniref:Phosphopentomutase n=1 Tax=Brachyspira catarrhinii TaxID=2528966 RepID=A0ABY2TPJ1_9SPIR|nr:phosphopentomutase [Brachyspira catarrhinii]TKZ31070.1 phosphopentomutase [Brachyspira catarrhinii]
MSNKKAVLIVIDSCGVGALPDAKDFGDEGVNTISNLAKATGGINIPNMEKMGLGNITDIEGVSKTDNAIGYYGKSMEKSKAKDTTTGHWEIAGLISKKPFNTYPNGFPKNTIEAIEKMSSRKVVCNKPYSGTEVIDDYADEQLKNGSLIVYTSADSVLQIAAHEEIISIEELYKICEKSLEICNEFSPVARVIARPYLGEKGNYKRTERRHDYSVPPSGETMLDRISKNNLPVIGIGKTSDIFAGAGITENRKTNKNNLDGIEKTIKAIKEIDSGLIFTNLVDFDMLYGHRRDAKGYKNALEEFDKYIPEMIENLNEEDLFIITADHGCDPTYKGSDHTREYIPILAFGKKLKKNVNIGIRDSFISIAASIEKHLLGKTNLEGDFL